VAAASRQLIAFGPFEGALGRPLIARTYFMRAEGGWTGPD
jgi:hypothetical protein